MEPGFSDYLQIACNIYSGGECRQGMALMVSPPSSLLFLLDALDPNHLIPNEYPLHVRRASK